MGIQMTIKDTDAVTIDELLTQLPHSKAAKEVARLRQQLQDHHESALQSIGAYEDTIAKLTAERDLFKKETIALVREQITPASIRDDFAKAALTGLIANSEKGSIVNSDGFKCLNMDDVCVRFGELAYQYADSMLESRKP